MRGMRAARCRGAWAKPKEQYAVARGGASHGSTRVPRDGPHTRYSMYQYYHTELIIQLTGSIPGSESYVHRYYSAPKK